MRNILDSYCDPLPLHFPASKMFLISYFRENSSLIPIPVNRHIFLRDPSTFKKYQILLFSIKLIVKKLHNFVPKEKLHRYDEKQIHKFRLYFQTFFERLSTPPHQFFFLSSFVYFKTNVIHTSII
jgi:hypothetical protein